MPGFAPARLGAYTPHRLSIASPYGLSRQRGGPWLVATGLTTVERNILTRATKNVRPFREVTLLSRCLGETQANNASAVLAEDEDINLAP